MQCLKSLYCDETECKSFYNELLHQAGAVFDTVHHMASDGEHAAQTITSYNDFIRERNRFGLGLESLRALKFMKRTTLYKYYSFFINSRYFGEMTAVKDATFAATAASPFRLIRFDPIRYMKLAQRDVNVFDLSSVKDMLSLFKYYDLLSDSLIHGVMEDLRRIVENIPPELREDRPVSKIYRTMIGAIAFQMSYALHSGEPLDPAKLEKIIRCALIFGSSYMFDIYIDSRNIDAREKTALMGDVVRLFKYGNGHKTSSSQEVIRLCYGHLALIKRICPDNYRTIHKLYYALCLSQLSDRKAAHVNKRNYFKTYITKAALCRLILFAISGAAISRDTLQRHLLIGLSNQILDDFRDYTSDVRGNVQNVFARFAHSDDSINPLMTYLVANREISRQSHDTRRSFRFMNYRLLQGLRQSGMSLAEISEHCITGDARHETIRSILEGLLPYAPLTYDVSEVIAKGFEEIAVKSLVA